jgi:hypothetical protein
MGLANEEAAKTKAPWKEIAFGTEKDIGDEGLEVMVKEYENLVQAFETKGARLVEAMNARDMGMSDISQAYLFREVSTDLPRRGSSKLANQFMNMVPFLRVGLQGGYKMIRRVKGPTTNFFREAFGQTQQDIRVDPSNNFEEVAPKGRVQTVKDAARNSGIDKYLMGMSSMMIPTIMIAKINSEYYAEEYRAVPDETKDTATLIPRFKDWDQAIIDIRNGKKPELADGDAFFPLYKSFDWGYSQNMIEHIVHAPWGKKGGAFVESVLKSIAYLSPASTDPFILKPAVMAATNTNQFGDKIVNDNVNLLGEDMKNLNTLQMSQDAAKFINGTLRGWTDKDGKNFVSASMIDAVAKAMTPGILENIVTQLDAGYRHMNENPTAEFGERRMKTIGDNETLAAMSNTLIGDIALGVFDRTHLSGNKDVEDIYDIKK